ncbi:MAG: hypothetical protein P4L84_38020, partial [Isosphaeraceae bacterium]|nr:hypothetical protein [Isosphaeraceae bacterium]
MASNAAVEKIKALGLRHGEKAGVGLAAALCVLLLVMAAGKETIKLTPEQVKKSAEQASANINKEQSPESILERLEQAFLKKPEFEQVVDSQAKTLLVAANYKTRTPWVSPEPGAGLLRDDPVLIAVTELYAYPGRGGVLMYELTKEGERIKDDGKGADEDTKARRIGKKKRRRAGGMMGSAMMASGRSGAGKSKKNEEQIKKEREKEYLAKKKILEGSFAGGKGKEKDEPAEEPVEEGGPYKEKTVGKRWVALTGTIDHKQLRDNFLLALKRPEAAHPHYKRLDVERQTRQPDGTWTDWEAVDAERNEEVILNLPEEEEELTPDEVRFEALVDPLPFLKAGYWERVHIGSLVPKEKKEIAKPDFSAQEGMAGMPPGMAGSSAGMAGRMAGMMPPDEGRMGSGMMMPGMMPGSEGMSAAAEDTNFPKSESDTIMIRSLDFTVEPDATYRYRVRIVLYNPNFEREDVNPGVNKKDKYLKGPWSEPSEEATMPADLTAYAFKPAPNAKQSEVVPVQFQVTRWNPEDGVTVVRTFDAAPGDIIGENASVLIPTSDGSKASNKTVDFNTHHLVLDSAGGTQPLPAIGINGNTFEAPVLSLLVRPDGSVVARNQALDLQDEVRADIVNNYEKEKKDS